MNFLRSRSILSFLKPKPLLNLKMFFRTGVLSLCILISLSCTKQQNDEGFLHLSQCQTHCRKQFELCNTLCVNHCAHCNQVADESAEERYGKYVQEQEIQGETIAREVDSYRDPLKCRKVTCNCSADFTICEQGCTGIIQKQLRAKPYCP